MKATNPSTESLSARELADDLASQRDRDAVRRADELARLAAEAEHDRALADVAEKARRAELDRSEREASGSASATLARVYRESKDSGERTRIAAHMARSGEARALRLERLRTLNLRVLVPVLLGFAAWSTTGVQAGGARLMQVTDADPTWWALWVLEPVLIGAVVWVIVVRARLAACGGRLNQQAAQIAAGCLSTSIGLNLAAAAVAPASWSVGSVATLLGSLLAHSIGAAGAAATAHLIGVVDESIADADPWTDEHGVSVPLLADLNLDPESLPAPAVEPVQTLAPSFGADLPEQRASAAKANRPNKGVRVPPAARRSAKPPSARAMTDDALRERLAALVSSGDLPENAPVRRVQSALGISFDRAKRVMAAPLAA
ncbi:hypothetical protein [Actinomadura roseirufa]|uniref:hypothetical protein n=1 Tax=Actinomadura roseirufa TaxID=2094049 RepID=UPI0013F16C7A|nr:hypothetical protein [Actinomadura roseirufa]